jgi:hypothetical protein
MVSCDALDGKTKIVSSTINEQVVTVHKNVFRLDTGLHETSVTNRYGETIPAYVVVSEEHGIEVFFNFSSFEYHDKDCYIYNPETKKWDDYRCEDHAPVKE